MTIKSINKVPRVLRQLSMNRSTATRNNICYIIATSQLLQHFGLWLLAESFVVHRNVVTGRHQSARYLMLTQNSFWLSNENVATDSMEGAFQDSIVLVDDTIKNMFIVFVVAIGVLLAFSILRGKVDQAIQIIVRDFAATLEKYYPTRWKNLQENELLGLNDDDRDVKLFEIMEKWEKEDPKFMSEVKQRMNK